MSAESRKDIIHWEIDTEHGKSSNQCILMLLERKNGFVMFGKLPNKSTVSLNKRTIKLISRYSDNGTEFHQYKNTEEKCDVKFYFANPYLSWERGSNENANGLIRQYLPKTNACLN